MRKTPFISGYRPLFEFNGANTKISGKIDLIDTELFHPGKSGTIQITFNKGLINESHFKVGEVFTFSEGVNPLGKGEIVDVINL